MHNLQSNFEKIYQIAKQNLQTNEHGNFQFYPNPPKLNDLKIISLAISVEAIGLDSENFLYGKLKEDYPTLYKLVPDRTNYNRRKRRLRDRIDELSAILAAKMTSNQSTFLIDSMPIPICRMARANHIRILNDDESMKPTVGYLAIDKMYFKGYKLHMLTAANGVVTKYSLSQAHIHDVKMMNELTEEYIKGCELIGDKGYFSQSLQLSMFENNGIEVITPNRTNQVASRWNGKYRYQRKRIETVF